MRQRILKGSLAISLVLGSALFLLPGFAGETPAAKSKLQLVDNFLKQEQSNILWANKVAGSGTVTFEKGRAVLDMPAATEECKPKLSQMFLRKSLKLAKEGDSIRTTWDMQLIEDRDCAFGFGICIGDTAGAHIGAGQVGRRCGTATAHAFYPQGVPLDNIDHGTGVFHYDMTVTLTNAKTGDVMVDLIVYKHDKKRDAEPETYAGNQKPEASFSGEGKVPVGGKMQMWFCVEIDTPEGDPYIYQARGKVAVTNVFVGESAAVKQPEYFKPGEY